MSGSHHHSVSAAGKHRWRLTLAFALVAVFFVVELVTGLMSSSLALISDAGHMAADVVTLGAALLATALATRTDTSGRRTFGYYRAEVFASAFAVLVMLGVSVYIVVEAIGRIGTPVEPAAGMMAVVGVLGLIINLICLLLLRSGAKESLNVKGAYLEVIADSLGSVGVIAAAILLRVTGQVWWDTVIALVIAVFVAVRACLLGREVLAVLGQHAPAGIEPSEIVTALAALEGVEEVHDLHVWQLTSGMNVASAHLVSAPGRAEQVLASATATFSESFKIEHVTVQVESADRNCEVTRW